MMLDLIDAHAELHRAHHAPFTELAGPGGQPTKALFLFLRLVYKHALDEGAATIVCWDTPKDKLLRRKWCPRYKADRNPGSGKDRARLESQIIYAKKILADAGVRQARAIGWEADDVIATLARRERGRVNLVRMVARDKDLHQCVRGNVVMLNSSTHETAGVKEVCAKWGVKSVKQILEVQTLMGDSTDNVTGVPGIGPVKAVKLIEEFGTAFNVFAHAGSRSETLDKALKQADYEMLRKLIKLNDRCKIQMQQRHSTIDFDRAKPTLKRLGIRHLDA